MNIEIHSTDVLPINLHGSTTKDIEGMPPESKITGDYTNIVRNHTTSYTVDDYYIHAGTPKLSQGWMLHITVVQTKILTLLDLVLPQLVHFEIPFKLIKNKDLLVDLNGGKLGYFKIGKAITLFFDDETKIVPLLENIIPITKDFVGPQVFSDFRLSNIFYIRYGSFIPIIGKDAIGNKVSLMRDPANGQIIADQYSYPPLIPAEVSNPFAPLLDKMDQPMDTKYLGKKFFPVKLLKADTKGDVWKGFYFSKYLIPRFCVIKQGRRGMFPDDAGRDARDRIAWQYKVNKELENHIPSARIINYFEDDGQAYIVMEYIKKSKDLIKAIFDKFENLPWFMQTAKVKTIVIQYLLKIITAIYNLQQKGFVHRDITGTNFLVTQKDEIRLIDLELIYSLKDNLPHPPFGLGTHGFMSPEQELRESPTVKDDSYSIGSLMIMILSGGIAPNYVLDKNHISIKRKLEFLVRDSQLEELIIACVSVDPDSRPAVEAIYQNLSGYLKAITDPKTDFTSLFQIDKQSLEATIQKSINTIGGKKLSYNGLWFSNIENSYGPEVYPLRKKHFFPGIYRGISGTIWLLSKLKGSGYDISSTQENLQKGLSYLENEVFPDIDSMDPSFYYGKAGLAVMLSAAIDNKLIPEELRYKSIINKCFESDAYNYDLVYGMAGQGLALLHCLNHIDIHKANALLDHYVRTLIAAQNEDGSWAIKGHGQVKDEKKTGFGYGIAGICYYLIHQGGIYKNPESIQAGLKGLEYLNHHRLNRKNAYEWANSDLDKRVCTWWCNGAPGIILAYLKAYEVTKEKEYLDIVRTSLSAIPKYLIYQDLSQCHGLSGLGEIYLEAYRITNEAEWKDRATWIANLILNLRIVHSEKEEYWLVEKQDFPTADLMIGNSGVIHFLSRYDNLNNIPFLLIAH